MSIYDKLRQYSDSGVYPMHMPGHKRNPEFYMENPYEIDVTEVEGTDNLHRPEGMIREFTEAVKSRYGTRESYLLVNGSTCGILAAISACCRRGDAILMDRCCHRAVYHAVYLLELKPVYMLRERETETGIFQGLEPEQVREVLAGREVSCAVVTSPTYEGVVSDIRRIADIVHEKEIPLIVDEAHGAHFTWGENMPAAATGQGADLVVESLHKTLPALTQTGLLHLCSGRVRMEEVERYLAIYQTSSPSYVLMAGAGKCMEWLEREGEKAFKRYGKRLAEFVRGASRWRVLSLWKNPEGDPSKLVILSGGGMSGRQLMERLRTEYAIETEMAAERYVLAMTSVCDTDEGFEKLLAALTEIDRELAEADREAPENEPGQELPRVRMSSYEAVNSPWEAVAVERGLGRTSAEYAFFYPPGVPFLVPGEEITEGVIACIQRAAESGTELMGLADRSGRTIRVCR